MLSEDVRQRMREANQSSETPRPPKPESRKPDAAAGGHSSAEMPEELRKRFELEQALLREELARITRREKESVGENVNPAVLQERARTKEEQKNVQNLTGTLCISFHCMEQPAELNAWSHQLYRYHYLHTSATHHAKQLARKDAELKHLAAFYKEQLQLLENKNKDYYQQSAQMYNEAAAKASSNINTIVFWSVTEEYNSHLFRDAISVKEIFQFPFISKKHASHLQSQLSSGILNEHAKHTSLFVFRVSASESFSDPFFDPNKLCFATED
ncbi:MICOS complex subunit MIC25 isoform X1 [Silurus asotus]|uniref:MICOS complex subunit MIC25 isoform X1 n=1 Tax=Silurus asotus TaxID=30991 RepID=A0AAD5FTD1_SILAS|nr:MICOS complex subunit MIC25 isoform X1 [Silurus asotus]